MSIVRYRESHYVRLLDMYVFPLTWSLPSHVAELSRSHPQKGKREEGTAVRRLQNSLRAFGRREARSRLLYLKLLHFTCISQLFDLGEGVDTHFEEYILILKENVTDTQQGCKIFMTPSVRRAI